MSDATLLLELQEIDLQMMRAKKELDSLPEKDLIIECRKRKSEALKKRAQIVDMADEVDTAIDDFQTEDAKLAAELADCQSEMDGTSDYRQIKSLTRQMEGIVKRREKIEFKLGQLAERSEKVDAAKAQISAVLSKLEEQEDTLTKRYQTQGGKKVETLAGLKTQRAAKAAEIAAPLLERYERLLKNKGGIAVGYLDGRLCSVCHVEYQEGQLSKVRAEAPIATCPNCNRILIVEE